jgi:hypothetical protein
MIGNHLPTGDAILRELKHFTGHKLALGLDLANGEKDTLKLLGATTETGDSVTGMGQDRNNFLRLETHGHKSLRVLNDVFGLERRLNRKVLQLSQEVSRLLRRSEHGRKGNLSLFHVRGGLNAPHSSRTRGHTEAASGHGAKGRKTTTEAAKGAPQAARTAAQGVSISTEVTKGTLSLGGVTNNDNAKRSLIACHYYDSRLALNSFM